MEDVFSVASLFSQQVYIGDFAHTLGFSQRLCACPSLPPSEPGVDTTPGIQFLSFRPEAPKIIMVISGTHGVEGPAGYDLQMKLLENRVHEKLPVDTGLVFVAALNPWGWANGRRTDENNVDLNRNGFPDVPLQFLPLDSEINALINPKKCDEGWYRKLSAYLANPLKAAFLHSKVFHGQYDNPEGIFYGGTKHSWSLTCLKSFLCKHLLTTCEYLAVLDIHTGFGEWGEITLTSPAQMEDGALIKRCRSLFGLGVSFPNLNQTVNNAVWYDLLTFVANCLPGAQTTEFAVEVGTVPFEESFPFFVAENRLHHHPGERAFLGTSWWEPEEVKDPFCGFFYPPIEGDDDVVYYNEWPAAVCAGFMPIFRTVIRGLSEL